MNYNFPNRDIVQSKEWRELVDNVLNLDSYCYRNDNEPYIDNHYSFSNDTFAIAPFSWDDEDIDDDNNGNNIFPNFWYKPIGLKIWWYKYPFRASEMNQDVTEDDILSIFQKCIDSVKTTN